MSAAEERDEEETLHTWVIAFTSDRRTAETAAVVFGTILDNFRGLSPVEFTDESMLAEPTGHAVDVLHEVLTGDSRLSEAQRGEIAQFAKEIEAWRDGDEGGEP